MSSKKISQLPVGVSLGTEDLFIVARGGANYSLTGQNVIDAVTFDPTTINNDIIALQNDRLKLDGSNSPMTGALQMDTHKVTSTYVPVNPEDFTNKLYVDSMVPLAGGSMTGLLLLSGDAVASLGAVTLQQLNAAVAGITPPSDTNDLVEGSDGSAVGGSGIEVDGNRYYYTQARWESKWAGKDADDLPEGIINQYFTTARFDTALATKTSDNIIEGSINLYYTDARARASISATSPILYDNLTGVISYIGEETSFGNVGEIPFVNAAGTDFDYSSNFTFDEERLIITPAIGGGTSILIGDANTGANATSITDSILIGGNAGNQTISSTGLVLIGHSAGSKELGNGNIYIGDETGGSTAAAATVTNTENTIIGYQSAGLVDTADYNTGVGSTTLMDLTTGSTNIAIGYLAGGVLETGSNNIYIGPNVNASAAGSSNELKIGNGAVIPISADLSTGAVTINGVYTLPTADSVGANYFLQSDGAGTVTWETVVYSINTGTGLTGGPITSTGTIDLDDTAVTPGSYTNADITVDQQGRITAAANGSAGSPTGSTGDFQWNNAGAFAGGSPMVTDGTTIGIGNSAQGVHLVRIDGDSGSASRMLRIEHDETTTASYAIETNLSGVSVAEKYFAQVRVDGGTENQGVVIALESGGFNSTIPDPADIGFGIELSHTTRANYGVYVDATSSNSQNNYGLYSKVSNAGAGEAYGLVVESGASIIGGTAPDASALFQIDSTTQGFLPPRMTNAQMTAIGSPATGLLVYDTNNNQWMGYNGTSWVILG